MREGKASEVEGRTMSEGWGAKDKSIGNARSRIESEGRKYGEAKLSKVKEGR